MEDLAGFAIHGWGDLASDHGIMTRVADYHGLVSDNSSFAAYGVPNANRQFWANLARYAR